MKTNLNRLLRRGALALVLCALATPPVVGSRGMDDKKTTVDDLIAGHLAAIGKPEARAAASSCSASGTVRFVNRSQAGDYEGKGIIASNGSKVRLSFQFQQSTYLAEQLAFDGERAGSGFLPNSRRSTLGRILIEEDVPLKEGLLGGVLSAAWPLLRENRQNVKLEYKGLKKVEGQQLHEVSFKGKKMGRMNVLLYFDPQNFRHLRTVYKFDAPERLTGSLAGSPTGRAVPDIAQASGTEEAHFSITEDFGDFRQVDGLTLPHSYKLRLNIAGTTHSLIVDWTLAVDSVTHKEKLDDSVFNLPH